MADLSILAGATSVSIEVDLYVLATGAPQTGLVYNSSGLTAAYAFPNAAPVSITLATLASNTAAYSSGGFYEKDATKSPGLYRLDLPNAAIASGRQCTITFTGYSGMATRHIKIELTGWDNQDAVHGGMSALPNTACTTNASLLTSGTGTDQLSVASGRIDAGKILGTAISSPATAGILDVNIKNMNNVAATAITTIKAVQGLTTADTIATYTGNTVQTGDAYARLGAPAGASTAADIAAVKTDLDAGVNMVQIAGSTTGAGNLKRSTLAICTGTVGSSSSTTSIANCTISPTPIASGQFIGRIVIFDSTTTTTSLRGQATNITANDTSGNLTVTALTNTPANGDTFTIT